MAFFGTSVGFGSLLNSPQTSFRPQIIGIGSSLLSASIDAKLTLAGERTISAETRASINAQSSGDAVIPPWKVPEETKTLNQQVREVRELTQFIDLDSDELSAVDDDVDSQATFAIFRALSNLRILAEYAAEDDTITSSLERLDSQFQDGMDEVRDFMSTTDLEKLDLFLGEKEYKTEATTRTGKNETEFDSSLITSDPNAAIDGLTGTEVFTVSITKSGNTDDITVDLSGISGDLSLNNISDHINAQIEALIVSDGNGDDYIKHGTRFDVYRDGDTGQYGLQIEGTLTEEVALSAAAADPALYVAGYVEQLDDDYAITSRITEVSNLDGTLTVDDTFSFAGIDYAGSEIKQKVDEEDDDDLDPNISALRDKFLVDAADDVGVNTDEDESDVDNTLSITNVDSDFVVKSDTAANRVVVDSEGGIYVVGSTQGSFGHQLNAAETQDVFLTKFDSEGNEVFSRLLGVSGEAEAFGITVDSADNVIIVGKTDSELSTDDVIDATDAFVTKISKRGDEVFRYQLDKFGESAAYSVAVDTNDDIYVGGYTESAISSTSGFSGGQDALILKLSGSDGTLSDSNVFGTSGDDVIKGIAVDSNDNLVVATESNGDAVIYRLDGSDLTNQTDSVTLGSLGSSGSLEGIAIDTANDKVYVSGVTTNSSLDASGAASVNETAQGAQDGFVSGLTLSGSTLLTADFTTYLSTAGTDRVQDVVVNNGTVYVAGTTSDALSGETARGSYDSFAARINGTSGALENVEQFGEGLAKQMAGGVAFTSQGNSVLSKLGLPTGTVQADETLDLETQTSAREGDFFYISVDGDSKTKIELDSGDTFEDLKRKIRIAGFGKLEATVSTTSEGEKLEISTLDDGVTIDLLPGSGGRDLLERIGLNPGTLVPKDEIFDLGDEDEESEPTDPENLGGVFALGLEGALHIKDKATAKYVLGKLDTAISNIQRAFRSLTYDPIKALLLGNSATEGPVPTHIQNQLANYQTGLARLQSGASAPSASLFV
jgi:hypothetical protein